MGADTSSGGKSDRNGSAPSWDGSWDGPATIASSMLVFARVLSAWGSGRYKATTLTWTVDGEQERERDDRSVQCRPCLAAPPRALYCVATLSGSPGVLAEMRTYSEKESVPPPSASASAIHALRATSSIGVVLIRISRLRISSSSTCAQPKRGGGLVSDRAHCRSVRAH